MATGPHPAHGARWDNRRVTSPDLPERETDTSPAETPLEETTVTVRRSPRIVNFMILGAVVGALVAVILTFAYPENPQFGRAQVLGFLLLACTAVGVAIGCIVALVLGRVVARTSTTVVAGRVVGSAPAGAPDAASTAEAPSSPPIASGETPHDPTPSTGDEPGIPPSRTTHDHRE